MEWIKLIVGSLLLFSGLAVFAFEIFGIFKLKFSLNRMHAAAMGDTLGLSLSLLGVMIFTGFGWATLKLLLVIVFLWCASPVASHLLARLEVMTNDKLDTHAAIYRNYEEFKKEVED